MVALAGRTRKFAGQCCAAIALTALCGAFDVHGQDVTYADLAPILGSQCVICHQGEGAPLGLKLDSSDGLLAGSRNGPIVKAGNAAESELIRRLRGTSQPRMPMTGPPFLTEADIARFERWITAGMKVDPPQEPAPSTAASLRRPGPGEVVTYLHVAPILATRCAKCHADRGIMGSAPEGFRLTSHEATLSPSDRVRVVPGHPDASELVRRIRGQALPRMPFDGPPYLGDDEIALIVEWIAQGARDASGHAATVPVGAEVRLNGALNGRWLLDGLPLTVSGNTRLDNSPEPGDYVEVRGRIAADGSIVAERIRPR